MPMAKRTTPKASKARKVTSGRDERVKLDMNPDDALRKLLRTPPPERPAPKK